MSHKKYLLFLAVIILFPAGALGIVFPTDTLKITLHDADSLFLSRNLLLLAAKYNIDAAKAQILQSRLWNNPNINYEINPYNQYTHRFLDLTGKGESLGGIEQLILLAGKRNKRIFLERINAEIAEYQFYDLLRTLKYQLRTTCFNLHYFEQILRIYDKEIGAFQKLIDQSDIQLQKGNVSLKENTRLKAEFFLLKKEKLAVIDSTYSNISNLKLLIGDTTDTFIHPLVDTALFSGNPLEKRNLAALQKTALESRYDLKLSDSQVRQNEANLNLQKALAVPDLTIHANYDHQNNYITDYFGVGFSIDLPLFNRNQGNIKSSEFQIEQSKMQYMNQYRQVINEVMLAYLRTTEALSLIKKIDTKFSSDLQKVFDGILSSYENRSISMLEFIDYYESYKQTFIFTNQLKNELLNHFEELNFVTGSDLFNKQ